MSTLAKIRIQVHFRRPEGLQAKLPVGSADAGHAKMLCGAAKAFPLRSGHWEKLKRLEIRVYELQLFIYVCNCIEFELN